ncbi:hypothetical protein [Pseudomonas putida]|uniref:Uncharacterized protein n=1 Tax=Pseudomonas putida TaxID=303 RepID=A0A7V8J1P5_PSEPU|nr:hypothetical protein [Pseudomonas putida]KAF0251988.1 hypothetical protein GN299_25440 [Pseudomonas putida]
MNISDHLQVIKQLIEALPSSPTVKLFSGKLKPEDLKNLKLDGKRPHVLLSNIGGQVPDRSQRVKLELDSFFGAWVVGKVDPATLGMSFIAVDTAFEIASLIDNYRGDQKSATKLPVIHLIEESFNGVTDSKSGYSSWSVIWSQRIVLI